MLERRKSGAVDIIRGKEPLNLEHLREMLAALEDAMQQGQPRVVVDLEETPLIDSAGLELLLAFRDRYMARGGMLKLAAASPLCADILSVTGVSEQIELFSDTTSAVRSFAQ